MRTYPECIPCILRATVAGARLARAGEAAAWGIATEVARLAAYWDRSQPPILLGAEAGRSLRRTLGVADPYHAEKQAANAAALARYAQWKDEVARAPDPLLHALQLAAAGNSLDLGLHPRLDWTGVDAAAALPFARSDYDRFREALTAVRGVLYLADNAGEIVLDRILIEELRARGLAVTVAVRGGPTLNDATTDDAHAVGLDEVAEVITTGSDVPGVSLPASSPQFRTWFRSAELILSKGMGNFEGLSAERAPLFFLLQAKCPPVAQETGIEVGRLIFLRGPG
ncbi:MAG TPA: ARMT1-like domain-containing protein [Candidatus Bipolaricaulis anaerobius]|nr:ARMT1-like domain-containing protein [Candidatus Bipolaricaulis anaerobius]HNS23845.1 ARMT1-like domain-containing protein [Candidatus Bipolaricaulis anaerobius]